MRYGSVCSGIEAATGAWAPLGWRAEFFAEIEKFSCEVLAHHYGSNMPDDPYPDQGARGNGIPNAGDFTRIKADEFGPIDLLVGGTPCQSFSVAGKRLGLSDPRGNLALEYLRLAQRLRPRWLVWENVPGAFSSWSGGPDDPFDQDDAPGEWVDGVETSDFAAFLGFVQECGYHAAWRVLDAQFAGVPQRRRRIFLVGYLGDWRPAAAVLFERESLYGHPPPRREKGQGVAPSLSARSSGGGGLGTDFDCDGGLIAPAVTSKWAKGSGGPAGDECQNLVTHTLRSEGFDASEDGTGRGTPLIAVHGCQDPITSENAFPLGRNSGQETVIAIQERAVSENPDAGPGGKGWQEDAAFTLEARNKVQAVAFTTEQTPKFSEDQALTLTKQSPTGGGQPQCVAINLRGCEGGSQAELSDLASLRAADGGSSRSHVATQSSVRRLTPRECERLQGFPDDYTAISRKGKPASKCADGPRYKALGNSMAVPVMAWLGTRIEAVETVIRELNKSHNPLIERAASAADAA